MTKLVSISPGFNEYRPVYALDSDGNLWELRLPIGRMHDAPKWHRVASPPFNETPAVHEAPETKLWDQLQAEDNAG